MRNCKKKDVITTEQLNQCFAKQLGGEQYGYRCVINTREKAGQTMPHLHLHLLAGRSFGWPAG